MFEISNKPADAPSRGFDRDIDAPELGYHGPSFGWFAVPDQFTLHRTTAIRASLGSEPPAFTQIALVSVYRQSDWTALTVNYLKSLQDDFTILGDWLTKYLCGDGLVILLGDHQPPAIVGGEHSEWTVPIHVIRATETSSRHSSQQVPPKGFTPRKAPPHQGMEPIPALLTEQVLTFYCSRGANQRLQP